MYRTRYTLWNGLFGLLFNTLPSYCLTQQSFMRIKQARSLKSARLLLVTIAPIGCLNLLLILTMGFVMFGYYHRCGGADPFTLGQIANMNQLFTKFLTQFYAQYDGLLGFYIALLVSSAIGTISSVLKALSVILSEEMVKTNAAKNNEDEIDLESELSRNASIVRHHHHHYNHTKPLKSNGAADVDTLYEEHLLSIQIAKMPNRKRKRKGERVLKKFMNKRKKGASYLSKKVASILIVVCAIVLILASIGLYYVPGSLTSVAFSLLNAVHGPVLFIYMCARFNQYSLKRHKYAFNRSKKSKLRNFQFTAFDVIASCVLSIVVIESLFIGRLITSIESEAARKFYNADRLVLHQHPPKDELLGFCRYENNNVTTTATLFGNVSSTTSSSSSPSLENKSNSGEISFLYYFYAISFNWYPFIGFFMCCLCLTLLNLIRLLFKLFYAIIVAFKCSLRCC